MTTQSMNAPVGIGGVGHLLGLIARGILICIAAFWVWFCVADGLGDAREHGPLGFIMMLPAALIVLGALYIVWRWEYAGAFVLLGVGLLGALVAVRNSMQSALPPERIPGEFVFQLAIMSLPFFIPALLLFIKHGLERVTRS
jgi:hypothetical protein